MTAPIIRGMPYSTMVYSNNTLPVIASEVPIGDSILIDSSVSLSCSGKSHTAIVNKDVELYFKDSDFTWLVFYSRPVRVYCTSGDGVAFKLYVESDDEYKQIDDDDRLVVRTALVNNCSTGSNSIYCYRGMAKDASKYANILRKHARVYPHSTRLQYIIPKEANIEEEPKNVTLEFDWGVKAFDKSRGDDEEDVIMYALPHHLDLLQGSHEYIEYDVCKMTFHGNACLVSSNKWTMKEDLPHLGYTAPRPPLASFIPALSESLHDDLSFELPGYFMRGAGDTYFSGKMLAKLGRILVIADELQTLQNAESIEDMAYIYSDVNSSRLNETMMACKNTTLPSEHEFAMALVRLRRGVEIWINGSAETPFVYDLSWGGMISCGCWFNSGNQACDNAFPNCPTFSDPGLDFGNGKSSSKQYCTNKSVI